MALSGGNATAKTFSGEFDDTPADQALRAIVDAGGLSMVLPHGTYEKVSAHFKDAPVEDAVRAVCIEAGLRAERHGTVVVISRNAAASPTPTPTLPPLPVPRAAVERAGKDRVVAGDVNIGPGERVDDVVSLHGNVTLAPGSRARDVGALSGSIDIGSGAQVDGDVTAIGGDVRVASGARIEGDAAAIGGKVVVAPGATVHGNRANVNLSLGGLPALALPAAHAAHSSPVLHLGFLAAEFAVCFALGLVFLLVWPRGLERVAHALKAAPARSVAIGLLGTVGLPMLALLLTITVVGMVLLPVEGLLVTVGSLLGFSALALLIGRKLPIRRRLTPVGQLAVGTALMTVAINIPRVGGVVLVLAWIVVLGAVLATRFGSQDAGPHPTFPLGEAVEAQPR